jgi:mannose/fructose/N-acetylgalactosamine-specific phosphotransferase system component IIC
MKKSLLFVALGIFTLTACSKEQTCSCAVVGTVKAADYTMYNSKNQAKKICDNLTGDSITVDGLSGVADCEFLGH